MAESGAAAEHAPQGLDPVAQVAALRARGAARFDPVGLRFIEALVRRAGALRDEARHVLDRRLAAAVAEYDQRFSRAERDARAALESAAERFPEAGEALRAHCDSGDFGAFQHLLAQLETPRGNSPLAELLAHIGQHTVDNAPAPGDGPGAALEAPGELKSVRYFRSTWSRLSVDRQLTHAFAHAPENAGPLNSHFLVLQTLRQMRSISVEYVDQFMSYVDALQWLDQADGGRNPVKKAAARGERDKKRKAGRADAG